MEELYSMDATAQRALHRNNKNSNANRHAGGRFESNRGGCFGAHNLRPGFRGYNGPDRSAANSGRAWLCLLYTSGGFNRFLSRPPCFQPEGNDNDNYQHNREGAMAPWRLPFNVGRPTPWGSNGGYRINLASSQSSSRWCQVQWLSEEWGRSGMVSTHVENNEQSTGWFQEEAML